jgi:hypothetical protein
MSVSDEIRIASGRTLAPMGAFLERSRTNAVRTSPGRWGLAGAVPEVLAQVSLVHEAASQGDVTQRRSGGKHVFSGQFDAPSNDKGVR